jgi:hypothetical protein
VSWDRPPFTEPIELPKGKKLVTLRDAAHYITKLPKAEHDADEWQAAMQALLLVVEMTGQRCSRALRKLFFPNRSPSSFKRCMIS